MDAGSDTESGMGFGMSSPSERSSRTNLNISINEKQFHDTPIEYATFPFVSYDGFNFHIVMLSVSPDPTNDTFNQGDPARVRVVSRVALPWPSAEALLRQLSEVLENPIPAGLLGQTIQYEVAVEENDGTASDDN
jgi:hypothetical protein